MQQARIQIPVNKDLDKMRVRLGFKASRVYVGIYPEPWLGRGQAYLPDYVKISPKSISVHAKFEPGYFVVVDAWQ
jgi:hypothetical protein